MIPDSRILEEFAAGQRASDSDRPKSVNPWRPISDPELFSAWDAGWREAEGPFYKPRLGGKL
jgi:hypothetical protein